MDGLSKLSVIMSGFMVPYDRCKRAFTWNGVWLCMFFVGFGVFLIGMPKYIDDCSFMWPMGDWLAENGVKYPTDGVNPFVTGFPWDVMRDIWNNLYMADNARFSNLFAVIFLLFPKWIGSSICFVAWIYVMIGSLKLCNINIRSSVLTPVALAMWYILMPWQNHMGSLVFQFNYLIPSAISVFILRRCFMRGGGSRASCIMFFAGLMLGAWNEAFSVPFMVGIVATALFHILLRNRNTYALVAGLTIGLLWLFTAPAFSARCTHQMYGLHSVDVMVLIKRFAIILKMHFSIIVLILTESWVILRKGWRAGTSPMLLFVNVSAFCSLAISFVSTGTPRSGWWCDMISITGVLYVLQENYGSYWSRYRKSNLPVALLLTAFAVFSLLITDIYTVRTATACRRIIEAFHKKPGENVYDDWISGLGDPHMALSNFDAYPGGYLYLVPSYHISRTEMTPDRISIVPERLRSIGQDEGNLIPGEGRMRLIDGYIVFRSDSVFRGQGYVPVCFDNSRVAQASAVVVPFVSEQDGNRYYHLRIFDNRITRLFSKITSVGTYRE